jgi:hypothetical protein
MNISIPFAHPSAPPDAGAEQARVRGRYVSVEYVREVDGGDKVQWWMATASDAGGESGASVERCRADASRRIDSAVLDELESSGEGHRGGKSCVCACSWLIRVRVGCTVVRPLLERQDQEQCGRWYRLIREGDELDIVGRGGLRAFQMHHGVRATAGLAFDPVDASNARRDAKGVAQPLYTYSKT